METIAFIIYSVVLISQISALWIGHYTDVRRENRQLRKERSELFDRIAEHRAGEAKARKELSKFYAEYGRRWR